VNYQLEAIAAAAKAKADAFEARMDEMYARRAEDPDRWKSDPDKTLSELEDKHASRWADKLRAFMTLVEGESFSPHDLFTALNVHTSLGAHCFARQKLFNALNNFVNAGRLTKNGLGYAASYQERREPISK
jgi:hypothetical protein